MSTPPISGLASAQARYDAMEPPCSDPPRCCGDDMHRDSINDCWTCDLCGTHYDPLTKEHW